MRLSYFENNHDKLRDEYYKGVVDSVLFGVQKGGYVGTHVYLPPTFIGGPRDMWLRYLDSMSLVQEFGRPDLFFTITCNSNWPEIKECLAPGEEVQNQPDLVVRVFKAKLKLPDKEEDPYLHNLVVKHMMHGPCGELNLEHVCMQGGNSKNKFSCQFSEHIIYGKGSYPIYRRRDNNRTAMVRGKVLDNRWVVPYNPILLAEFNYHFNLEICCDIRVVKYLYKYVHKGNDRVAFRISLDDGGPKNVNEIANFRNARWVSPLKVVWRIYGFPLSGIYPVLLQLQVHLADYHTMRFEDVEDLEKLIEDERLKRSMLTEFF
ncbi:hypothetical protein LIER_35395 [Lithospermum erythrorhizon]|uniref:Helitron helicase-like domain-containing protein n=1 Tax=Lithospermum erythrorhizon TaxID=34254 RepID=A0AAV3NR47_LITER